MSFPVPAACVADAVPYRTPPGERPVTMRLHASEGPPPPTALLEAMFARARGVVNHYPDSQALGALLAERHGLEPDRLLVTAGADEAIDRICRAYLEPGRNLILADPGFEMIGKCGALVGASLLPYRWMEERFPVEEIRRKIDSHTGVVAVISPHNPTGLAMSEVDLRAVAESSRGKLLLVDLAYADFADVDLTGVALEYEHVVAVRTLSKAWGLAGLRIGYACGHPELISRLRAAGGPYAMSSLSLWLAEQWLRAGGPFKRAYVAAVKQRRVRIASLLRDAGAEVWPSQANFVFARIANAGVLREALAARDIVVRGFPGHPLLGDCLRIGCPPDEASMERFCRDFARIVGGTS